MRAGTWRLPEAVLWPFPGVARLCCSQSSLWSTPAFRFKGEQTPGEQ